MVLYMWLKPGLNAPSNTPILHLTPLIYTMSKQILSLQCQQEIELLERYVVSFVNFTIVFCSLKVSLGHFSGILIKAKIFLFS